MAEIFASRVIKTDVTAVKIVNDYVLVGNGNFLDVLDKKGTFLKKVKIFDGHKIHGIQVDSSCSNILLYGGCNIKTLFWDYTSLEFSTLHSNKVHDWILAARLLKNEYIALVVMLNKLIILDPDLTNLREILCEDKCILYSAFISYNETDELVVLSGTVFGEVLIWKVAKYEDGGTYPVVTKLTGHHGVIFSISYNEEAGYICSSSDDRSTILWSVEYKNIQNITLKLKIYGHQSRVFRCLLNDNLVITAGEDSYVNLWDFEGKLIRKISSRGPIWALDCSDDLVVSGGGDCGVLISSLHSTPVCKHLSVPECKVPKRIGILNNNNFVVITEEGLVFLYSDSEWLKINQHGELKSYVLLEVSKCRNLFSLCGYHGEVFIYKGEKRSVRLLVSFKSSNNSRIYSFHWLTCTSFLICENELTLHCLKGDKVIFITNFVLPEGKELWTSAACKGSSNSYIVGDRRGNIHVYVLGSAEPICTLKKVHSYLGVTRLYNVDNQIVSLGRDGTIKEFLLKNKTLVPVSTDKLPFSWLTAVFDHFILGFSGNKFIIWDSQTRRTLLEYACGGGHRSWDFHNVNNVMTFVYLQDRLVKSLTYHDNMCSVTLLSGFHTKTINSIKILPSCNKRYMVLSGGEDTDFRLSLIGTHGYFPVKSFKSHLSSIRSICFHHLGGDEYLVCSGGGRGQIICWKLSLNDGLCSEEFSYYEKNDLELYESEIRVMDLLLQVINGGLLLFAACSDGNINVFNVIKENNRYKLHLFTKLFEKNKCVTKMTMIKILQSHVLISLDMNGNLTLWDVTEIKNKPQIHSFKTMNIHQSGIADCCFKIVGNDTFILLSGGDDGSFLLTLFRLWKIDGDFNLTSVASFRDSFSHCAQVTGTWITGYYFMTASIDQKLLVFEWYVDGGNLVVKMCDRYNSAVADIQGLECEEYGDCFHVFLYGKGVEYVKCKKRGVFTSLL